MNINIISSPLSSRIANHARIPAFRRLAPVAAAAALFFAPDAASADYWLSGSTGANGSSEKPQSTLQLKKNEVVVLDANKTANPNFTPFTPWPAIDPSILRHSQLMNGNISPYMGWKSGDDGLYTEFNPYERLNGLIAKTPSLAGLMPSFFTQSDPVYLAGAIRQSNDETPDYIKAVTQNPFNVWPISIYSSDALDPVTGAPRVDMQNAAWVVLASTGSTTAQRIQLFDYFGEYMPVTGKGRPWDGSYSMITLEHVIFYGGYTSGAGGAINFRRSDGLTGNSNTRAILQVKGDIAIVGNMAGQLGGGIQAQDSIQFDGNLYMVGNMAGVTYDATEKTTKFATSGGGSYHGEGGAMRIGSGGQVMTFNKDAIFLGNLAAGSGGVMSIHNASTLQFNGKSVFMGNQAGLYVKPGDGREGGNGGAIVFSSNGNRAYFAGESYFIANEATGYGGAISSGLADSDDNGFFQFSANAQFTDNIAGFNPYVSIVYSNTTVRKDSSGNFNYPGDIATAGIDGEVWSGTTVVNIFSGTLKGSGSPNLVYGAKIRGGGAFYGIGTYLLFEEDAEAEFLRNSTNGVGGALYMLKNSTAKPDGFLERFAAVFYDDATFTGNVAAINGGAIAAGTYGVKSEVFDYNSGTATSASVYFGKAGNGSTLTMHGNMAYTEPTVIETDPSASKSGTAFSFALSTGTTVRASNGTITTDVPVFGGGAAFSIGGLYVESMYSFWHNQTGGSGGALLIGSGTAPAIVNTRMGRDYALVLNALDWKGAGSYSSAGDFALFQDNVAMRDGGAIAAHDGASLFIGSGAKFVNNAAGGEGGAIALGMTSGQTYGLLDAAVLDLRARVADIVFQGNRSGVSIDTSGVDFNKILDPLLTTDSGISADGWMTADMTTGRANDIFVGLGAGTGTSAELATLNMNAYEGMRISFNGGIAMDHSDAAQKNLVVNINTLADAAVTSIADAAITTATLDNTAPVGLIVLDNASADIEGVTTIGNGTLRIQGTSSNLYWGTGTSVSRAGTKFELQGPATLEANATINAETITIGAGATLRVLGAGANPGALTLNAGAGGVIAGSSLNLAGNGRLNLGLGAFNAGSIASISIGDLGHTSAQTLTIAKDDSTLADVTLDNIRFAVGLFDGSTSDKIVAGNITFTGATSISLTSLANGSFIIASANGTLLDNSISTILDYKGTALTSGGRMIFGTSVAGGNSLQLDLTLSNLTLDWNGANNGGSLTLASGNMTGGDTNYVLGDAINFGAGAANKTVSVDENAGFSGMTVTDDYTFTGNYGITTQTISGGAGDGSLTMDATGKTLTLDNANGAGQRNEFESILIKGGTVAAGNAAQLGAALSQITFENTSNNGAALLVTGTMVLNGDTSINAHLQSQRLDIADGNTATIATTADGVLYVINNTESGANGGVFNIGAGSTLNLDAQGDMAFLNNTAAQGGALALADNATANIDVAAGKTVVFGLQGDRELNTAANTSSADSIYGAASSVIEKNGAGILSINSDSSGFDGTLNVNTGAVMFGEGSWFGSSASRINVASGGLLGGAGILGGDLAVNGGRLSIDAGELFGRPAATSAQVLTILGDLSLDSATLLYSGFLNKSIEWSSHTILVGGNVDITGNTTVDFNFLATGVSTLIRTSATNYISLSGNTSLVDTGIFAVANNGTDLMTDKFAAAPDFAVSKGGVVVDPERYKTQVGYGLVGSHIVVTGSTFDEGTSGWSIVTSTVAYSTDASGNVTGVITGGVTGTNPSIVFEVGMFPGGLGDLPTILGQGLVLVSQTNFYGTTNLLMDTIVKNQKSYWTGEGGSNWDHSSPNWYVPGYNDNTFAVGDSVVFGATGTNGLGYDTDNEANRNITIYAGGLPVADMTFTGTGNWTFTGGEIASNAGANDYKDDEGRDLSTGQLRLDDTFTGTVFLLNSRVNFNGIYVSTGSTTSKLADIEIRNGTLVTAARTLDGNLISNDSTLIFQQPDNQEFKNTRIYGSGNIIQTGTFKITIRETGIIETSNYDLRQGTLEVDKKDSLRVAETFTVRPGALLLLSEGIVAGTLVNNGSLRKAPAGGDSAQLPPTDLLQIRDPSVGVSTIFVEGNYHSEGGTIELNTYRDAAMINNLFVTGNSSGTSKVAIRNITSLNTTSTTQIVLGTGTYFQPYGQPHSVNPNAAPKRDTPVFTTLGAQRDLKLVMDWDKSVLPSATVSSTVPFLTMTSTTYEVQTIMESGTVVSSATTVLASDTVARAHYYNADGSIANLGNTGITTLGTIETTTTSGTTIITSVNVATALEVEYGASEIDYSESRDNYKLIQGKDGNWYFRNDSLGLEDVDLPMMGAAPVMADMLAQSAVKAFYGHINARHDKLRQGWGAWTNYTHSEDRLRKSYYDSTMIKQDIFQVGADYVFVDNDGDYSLTPSYSVGGAFAFTKAEATRKEINTINIGSNLNYSRTDQSTLSVDTNTLSAYASARWWRFYLDLIAQYGINATYKADIDASVPFDMDGQVKGSRVTASGEFGIIINPPGLGQLEIYTQATGHWHHFGSVSSIDEPVDLTNSDGYNGIYDPNSPNGRRYRFTAPTTFRAEAGLRWGSHLKITDDLAVRPWGGASYGRVMSSDYLIYVDEHNIRNDMRGNYLTLQGGAAAIFKRDWQLYFTLGWTNGAPANNYTLSFGLRYHW